jgi:MFS family permease
MSGIPFKTNRSLWRLIAAEGISVAGDWILITAASIEIYRRTESTYAVSALLAAAAAPAILLAPFAGAMADRHDRRKIMVLSDLLVAALLLIGVFIASEVAILVAFLAVIAASSSSAFDRPASEALLPSLAGREGLGRANSALRLATRLSMIVGPAIAASLTGIGGFELVLLVDSGTFLLSAALVAGISLQGLPAGLAANAESAFRSSLSGVSYAARRLNIGAVISSVGITMLMGSIINAGTIAFVARELEQAPSVYGLLLAAEGAGAVAFAVFLMAVGPRLKFLLHGAGGVAATGLSCILLGAAPNLPIALAAMALMGMGVVTLHVAFASYLQQESDDAFRGRVMSLVGMAAAVGGLVGLAFAGPAIGLMGIRPAFVIAGLVMIVSAAPVIVVLRRGAVAAPAEPLTIAGG